MSITIKSRHASRILYVAETAADVRAALTEAVRSGAYLSGAYLSGADLSRADLSGADLSGADLSRADLSGADLSGAYLSRADLSGADLSGAYLSGADLSRAYLSRADLSRAYLSRAYLSRAYLSRADLSRADNVASHPLFSVRLDFWSVLDTAPREVPALREALTTGKVDGSTYHGVCRCLVGTIAAARGVEYDHVPGLEPAADRPAEQWFVPIKPGDEPVEKPEREGQYRAATAVRWLDEWRASRDELVKALTTAGSLSAG